MIVLIRAELAGRINFGIVSTSALIELSVCSPAKSWRAVNRPDTGLGPVTMVPRLCSAEGTAPNNSENCVCALEPTPEPTDMAKVCNSWPSDPPGLVVDGGRENGVTVVAAAD